MHKNVLKVKANTSYTIDELALHLSAEVIDNTSNNNLLNASKAKVTGVSTLKSALLSDISFLANNAYIDDCNKSKAGVVVTRKKFAKEVKTIALVVSNTQLAWAKVINLFYQPKSYDSGIHPTAIIGDNCSIATTSYIGAYAVIADNVTVCDNTVVGAHCSIGENCTLGASTRIMNSVTLYDNVSIGSNCIIHSGAVIGSDGFGFALSDDKSWYKIHQLGGVTIENNVEIGANTTVDCGALQNTYISQGVKLDNQIQIGHNVKIGAHTIAAAQVGVAGSTTIGKHCGLGGDSSIGGHLKLVDDVNIAGTSVVVKSIPTAGVYASGTGSALPFKKWCRLALTFEKLDQYASYFKKILATEKE